ncbi:MAG: chaperone NapD [Comamonas sp.]|jgi:nitrate reductase NapD|uniref:chaperone NapD n=1 Tax=Comamonas sp. TaxID=34028 RepID=UPI000F99FF17|nr:chaperone NapD [uncultured Comamonas sp.]MBP7646607.1 chaperone NapD [Comamonas sp.]
MNEELHIASLVIHVLPAAVEQVAQSMATVETAHVHGTHPNGKLVITLEGPSAAFIMDQVALIRQIAGVINVSLVYQHTEPLHSLNEGVTL